MLLDSGAGQNFIPIYTGMMRPEGAMKREGVFFRVLPAVLAFMGTFAVLANVFLYGDDFFYSAFSKQDATYYFSRNIQHYFMANGRVVVHLLVTLFLGINLWVWRICNAAMLGGIVYFSLRLMPEKGNKSVPAAICLAFILGIGMPVYRQSVYWLTGSFNYVYPILMLVIYWSVLKQEIESKKSCQFLPVLAFFASATVEQGGMMAFGLNVILLGEKKFFRKEKLKRCEIMALIASFAGIVTVVCSPAQFLRASVEENPVDGGLLSLIVYNVKGFCRNFMMTRHMAIFHVGVFSASAVTLLGELRGQYKKLATAALCVCVLSFIWWAAMMLGYTGGRSLYFLTCIFGYSASALVAAGLVYRRYGDVTGLTALVLAFGSQLMMIVSPVIGERNMLFYIAGAMIFTAWSFGLCGEIKQKITVYAVTAVLISVALIIYSGTVTGYWKNAGVYRENLTKIKEYAEQHNRGSLEQKKLPEDSYGWAMPYHNAYYEPYYNICFDIPQDTEVEWK